MKMFKKTAAIAASLLAVTLVGGASLTSADAAASYTTDLCVIATRVDDPTITAHHGNCTEVEASPEATATGQSRTVFTGAFNIRDRSLANVPVHVTVVNQSSGKVLIDQSKTLPNDGGDEFRYFDNLMQPASAPLPNYAVTLTIADKTYTYVYESRLFVEQAADPASDVRTYVAEAYAHYQNGAISAGYEVA